MEHNKDNTRQNYTKSRNESSNYHNDSLNRRSSVERSSNYKRQRNTDDYMYIKENFHIFIFLNFH